jgi:hypothetical protein
MAERAPTLAKQTIDDNPLLEAATQREISSAMGLRIERPLEIGRNPNAGYLQSFDAMVEIVPTEVAAMAIYKPSLLACPIRFNAGEKKINDSNKYADLIDLRMNQARRTLAEILNQALYGRARTSRRSASGRTSRRRSARTPSAPSTRRTLRSGSRRCGPARARLPRTATTGRRTTTCSTCGSPVRPAATGRRARRRS